MSISGFFLMLFLLVHLSANLTVLVSADLFISTCRFMGSNPFVLAMVPVLAAGVFIHLIYAILLTWHNFRARGPKRYATGNRNRAISFASKNMFVLGVIILGGLTLHLTHFWAKMQLREFMGQVEVDPYQLMCYQFSQWHIILIYVAWIIAVWFHLSHGFWSAFQSIGLNNSKWIKRLQAISYLYATLVAIGFLAIPIYFYLFIV